MNIVFWNCQGLRPKRKELQNYLLENQIESHLYRKSHFDHINKFVEAHSYHFTPLDSLHDNVDNDTDDNSDLVIDVDPDTLIRIV